VAGALDEMRRLLDGMASLEGSPPERTSAGAVRVAFGALGATPPAGADAPRTASGGSSNGHDDETSEIDARRAWTGLVTRALSEIDRGTFAKVVLSRTRHLAASPDLDPRRAFAFLEPRHPACARFLFARDGATFLGASPERLLSVRGRRALTEALAGSFPRRATGDDDRAQQELLASEKDRAEHAFVVSAIRASLAPLCEALAIPDAPHVRSLAHVHHLATPITATLRDHAHLLDLAARLHPTPALCGSPTDAARDFILAGEPDPRGWYGGAVGWLDAAGDGTLAVAIRSALVTPADAWIHAGAGIVRGSEPGLEYIETTIKERAMRDALEAAS
jgi:isochorismate synthase